MRVLALDSAAQPLELGKALFRVWGEILGQKTWPGAYCTRGLWKAWRVMPRVLCGAQGAAVLRSADRGCTGRQQCGLG